MNSNYVENDRGFFVKMTLFKDAVNKAKFILPFEGKVTEYLSRSLGKIPYIDITDKKVYDEHKLIETNKYIEELQAKGIDDEQLVEQIWEQFNKPEQGKKGTVVDIYDFEKKASYGSVLNTCDLSMDLIRQTDSQAAIMDFIIKVDDPEYQKAIKEGRISPTPSPAIYGSFKVVDGVRVYDPNSFLDFLHVANVTIPANGEHAKTKAFCEGELGACKKQMAAASAVVTPIENINNSITQDSNSMSEQTPQQTPEPSTAGIEVPTTDQIRDIFVQYQTPKEIVIAFEKQEAKLKEIAENLEKTSTKLQEFEAKEQARLLEERKSLISKHIDLTKHFKGDTEKFTQKVEWINKMFPNASDLSVYLSEAYPVTKVAEPEPAKGDNPKKDAAYNSVFSAEEILKQQLGETPVNGEQKVTSKKSHTWGSLLSLNSI